MPELFTIGHSNQSMAAFLALLEKHGIEVLVDVRSAPYSRYVPHFNRDPLQQAIRQAGLQYLYLGKELGGRPDGEEFYGADGHVLYDKVAESPLFLEGVRRLEAGINQYRVAIMCAEENPAGCHRHRLVTPVMLQRGAAVLRIRGNGEIVPDSDLHEDPRAQGTLFDGLED